MPLKNPSMPWAALARNDDSELEAVLRPLTMLSPTPGPAPEAASSLILDNCLDMSRSGVEAASRNETLMFISMSAAIWSPLLP